MKYIHPFALSPLLVIAIFGIGYAIKEHRTAQAQQRHVLETATARCASLGVHAGATNFQCELTIERDAPSAGTHHGPRGDT